MVSEPLALILDVTQFSAGVVSVLLALRIAYVLSANPIGEFTAELIYLRFRELRPAGWILLVVLVVEIAQGLLPFLERRGNISGALDLRLFLNTGQAIMLLIVTTMAMIVVNRYTHRALDRRIRESMETLAYLEGQRRRRRSAERGEWDRSEPDEE